MMDSQGFGNQNGISNGEDQLMDVDDFYGQAADHQTIDNHNIDNQNGINTNEGFMSVGDKFYHQAIDNQNGVPAGEYSSMVNDHNRYNQANDSQTIDNQITDNHVSVDKTLHNQVIENQNGIAEHDNQLFVTNENLNSQTFDYQNGISAGDFSLLVNFLNANPAPVDDKIQNLVSNILNGMLESDNPQLVSNGNLNGQAALQQTFNSPQTDLVHPTLYAASTQPTKAQFGVLGEFSAVMGTTNATTDSANGAVPSLRLPAHDHPVYGVNGIMCGISYYMAKGKRVYQINPELAHLKRDANSYGYNGLSVGTCWAYQYKAFFDGAHGSWQGGIHGTAETGAYSIVKSGAYKGKDRDDGEILYYSGPKGNGGAQPLITSRRTQRPVRVLRSSTRKGAYQPSKGIRFDGLYVVVDYNMRMNEQAKEEYTFELRRLPGQLPMNALQQIPDPEQRRLFEMAKQGY
ncbi:E3 ubiquitin-protein ligase UHRF1 [Colletotrichum trifolii]|uniref:E3 ubiquitin-protein ligase UHRF1 n=1 Tax=Colletotrichum trifolii TaxID=5466 RepID=A0A4V3HU15_COLTR|nr:E3 ubiquitin-protein ligase UHRF1 [Colletotrichum trifolii]